MTDLDAILAEIRELAGTPERLPTDVTAEMAAETLGLGRTAATDRMDGLVAQGLFESVRVKDPHTKRILRVWRRMGDAGSEAGGGRG